MGIRRWLLIAGLIAGWMSAFAADKPRQVDNPLQPYSDTAVYQGCMVKNTPLNAWTEKSLKDSLSGL